MRIRGKTFTTLLIALGAVSGVILVLTWADMLGSFAFIKPLIDTIEGNTLRAMNFARWTSVWLFAMLSVTMLGCLLMFFTKNKTFGIVCVVITIVTIICAIIVCSIATGYCYKEKDDVIKEAAAILTVYQAQILQLITLLLIPLAIQIIAVFRKNSIDEKESKSDVGQKNGNATAQAKYDKVSETKIEEAAQNG